MGSDVYSAICPISVTGSAMIQRWDHLTFLHWAYDADVVQALLPAGLQVEAFHGKA
jgi:uncharacterized protein YqjF (DUF2071 family)